jgi:glycine/D-amino acid oxidase-like deaminating enzyme
VHEPATRPVWSDQLPTREPVPPLDGDDRADVVIVGAGLTGLWTAYYLLETDPSLDVLLVEAEHVAFGASGRTVGWCSAAFPVTAETVARDHGREAALALRAALRDSVVEVGGVAAAEQIDCDFAFGGALTLARSRPQLERIASDAAAGSAWGDEAHLLGPDAVEEHVRATGVIGGAFWPDCARLQPAALARGLADVVLSRGARLVEGTRALRIAPSAVVTTHGTVRARYVLRATEAWSPQLEGSQRAVAAVEVHALATEPLPAALWDAIGLSRAETFGDGGHLPVRGQRTADGRVVLARRGAPGARASVETERLMRWLAEVFPLLVDVDVTHAWTGPVAVPRDGQPSVGLDDDGIGWAGGYGDDGVAAANLAGRTLADLVHGSDSALTRLPWVGHRSPAWRPGPLRWAGVSASLAAAAWADRAEARTGHESRASGVLERLVR